MRGLPSIDITFRSTGISAIQRGERGIVLLLLRDTITLPVTRLTTVADIPENLSEYNKQQIKYAFMGGQRPPKAVVIYVMDSVNGNLADALRELESVKFDYLAFPQIEEGETTEVATWIKSMRDTLNIKVKAVLPFEPADHEGIINHTTEWYKVNGEILNTADYCSRIAGLLAGTPLTISATFQPLPEVEDVPHLTKTELDEAIGKGEFLAFYDGEKVKIARAVNSFVTVTQDKGEDFGKIKIVDILDLIHTDLRKTAEDNYLGKYANSYDNKCLLISAIQGYFEQLELDGLLDVGKNRAYLNVDAQRAYLKGIGVNVDDMDELAIKMANTKDKVFLGARVQPLDAIEEIDLDVLV